MLRFKRFLKLRSKRITYRPSKRPTDGRSESFILFLFSFFLLLNNVNGSWAFSHPVDIFDIFRHFNLGQRHSGLHEEWPLAFDRISIRGYVRRSVGTYVTLL